LCYIRPLYDLARFAIDSQLYSYILLIPFISAWLIWRSHRRSAFARLVRTRELDSRSSLNQISIDCGRRRQETLISISLFLLPSPALPGSFPPRHSVPGLQLQDSLALLISSFLGFLLAIACPVLRLPLARSVAFPLAFLIFMVPLPGVAE